MSHKVVCTVVIPLFNKASEISRAIRSVLDQTVQAFETIVVDDGSSDGGSEIAQGFGDPRIRIVRQDNAGVSAARNRGIQLARQELIAFLDADDEWAPTFLETVLRLHNSFPQGGAFGTAYDLYFPDGHLERPKYRGLPAAPWEGVISNYFRASSGDSPISSSSVMVKKKVLNDVGCFPVGHKITEDLDTWMRIAFKYPIVWSSRSEAIYHVDGPSSARRTVRLDQDFVVIRTLMESMNQRKDLRRDIGNLISKNYLNCARYYLRAHDMKNGKRCLRKAAEFSTGTRFIRVLGRRILYSFPDQLQDVLIRWKAGLNSLFYARKSGR